MGYTTEFHGSISIDPPLSAAEAGYLRQFSDSRRMDRRSGPYTVDGDDGMGGLFGKPKTAADKDILDNNRPPPGQPGLWCKWAPNKAGDRIEWTGEEKFYDAPEWMAYLRSHFVVLGAARLMAPDSQGFWTAHRMGGRVFAVGEEAREDVWQLRVDDDGVFTREGAWTAKGLLDIFGQSGEAQQDDDGDDDADDWETRAYVGAEDALSALVCEPSLADWKPWKRVADFADKDPAKAGLLAAREAEALAQEIPAAPESGSAKSL